MKLNKMGLLTLMALCLSITLVSAADISDFNPPKGFDEGFGEIMENEDDFSIVLEDYDPEMDENPFDGDHFHKVTIKGKLAEYNDTFNDEVGVMEMIKIGKNYHIIKCKYADNTDASKINDCTKILKEFNEKNNLKPEKI